MKIRITQQLLTIITGCTLLAAGCATINNQKTTEYITSAKKNLPLNPKQTIESTNAVIKSNNSNADAYYLRALAYQQLNSFDASESDFQTALKLDHNNESYMVSYANLLCQEQNYTKAQIYYDQAYNQAKKLNHQLTKIYIDNGDCLTTQNKLEPAIASYTNALADESAPVTAYIGIAHAYVLQENYPIANYYLGLYKGIPNKQYLQIELVTLNGLVKTETKLTNREKIEEKISNLKDQLGIQNENITTEQKPIPVKKTPIVIMAKPITQVSGQSPNTFSSRIKTDKSGRNYIIIEAGDTLFRTSTSSNTSVEKLKNLNHLKNNELITGTKLYLN
ncbi:MAG: LysM peptidoglycan-binding domain-containing protein [Neisseriales bacterium]|nr:MAG: LysM peptidoglycan-binding domain-containing protein [Neisseriales bacterium]